MKPDQARQFLEQALAIDYAGAKAAEILVYCREQKPVLDAICDRVTAHVKTLLTAHD